MSNRVKVRKKSSSTPEGDWILACGQTQKGLEIHINPDTPPRDAKDWSYLLAGIAQIMAHKVEVDVDMLWSLAFAYKKQVAEACVIHDDKKEVSTTAAESLEDFTKTVTWN
jgi:hypothetical protein